MTLWVNVWWQFWIFKFLNIQLLQNKQYFLKICQWRNFEHRSTVKIKCLFRRILIYTFFVKYLSLVCSLLFEELLFCCMLSCIYTINWHRVTYMYVVCFQYMWTPKSRHTGANYIVDRCTLRLTCSAEEKTFGHAWCSYNNMTGSHSRVKLVF